MGPESNDAEERTHYSEWGEMKRSVRSIICSFPHLLSHHPHCKYYDKDVLHIGRWRLCWGCIVTYPTMIITLAALLFFNIHNEFTWWQFIVAGTILGSFELISLWRKGRGLRHRTIKLFLGIGLASMTIGVFSIPIHLFLRFLIFTQLFLIASFFGSIRILAMEKKCKRCRWNGNWFRCPGFEELNSKLERKGLLMRK